MTVAAVCLSAKDLQTLRHELAHGLYGTNENYREKVAQSLAKLPPKRWDSSRRVLLDLGDSSEDLSLTGLKHMSKYGSKFKYMNMSKYV